MQKNKGLTGPDERGLNDLQWTVSSYGGFFGGSHLSSLPHLVYRGRFFLQGGGWGVRSAPCHGHLWEMAQFEQRRHQKPRLRNAIWNRVKMVKPRRITAWFSSPSGLQLTILCEGKVCSGKECAGIQGQGVSVQNAKAQPLRFKHQVVPDQVKPGATI